MRCLLPLLLAAACASTRATVQNVADASARDLDALVIRVPTKQDLAPARAADPAAAMRETEKEAQRYLADYPGRRRSWDDYVRALLACAYLAQGRNEEAKELTKELPEEHSPPLMTREKAVIGCTVHAALLCSAVDARAAVERMFAGELAIEEFVRRHGSAAGIRLPSPKHPDYAKLLKLEVSRVQTYCFPGGLQAERVEFHRNELRRLISEQIYNEVAALVVSLPPRTFEPLSTDPRAAIERWLAKVAVAGTVIQRHLMADLLPADLDDKQKEWQREQAHSLFERAREAAGYFLSAERRQQLKEGKQRPRTPEEELYDRLERAEEAVLAWITLR